MRKMLGSRHQAPEKIPGAIKRCPNCHRLTLVYDPEQRRIYCTSCGFQAILRA